MLPDVDDCTLYTYAMVDIARRIDPPYSPDGSDPAPEHPIAYSTDPIAPEPKMKPPVVSSRYPP